MTNLKCDICGADLTEAVKLLGEAAWTFHQWIHERDAFEAENARLRRGLEYLRDGGFGCAKDAQAILDGEEI